MAVHQYRLTCRGMLGPQVIVKLFRRGIYWARGGPTALDAQRRRHHLRIRAETEPQAIERARSEIERAGGSAREIAAVTVVGRD